jgi:hypothetical protein
LIALEHRRRRNGAARHEFGAGTVLADIRHMQARPHSAALSIQKPTGISLRRWIQRMSSQHRPIIEAAAQQRRQ